MNNCPEKKKDRMDEIIDKMKVIQVKMEENNQRINEILSRMTPAFEEPMPKLIKKHEFTTVDDTDVVNMAEYIGRSMNLSPASLEYYITAWFRDEKGIDFFSQKEEKSVDNESGL